MDLVETEIGLVGDKLLSLRNEENAVGFTKQDYIHAATSNNTRKAYQSDIRHFMNWGGLLPASPESIVNYLHQHAAILNSRTLHRRLTAIKQWHLTQSFADPTSHPYIRKTLTGIKNTHGKPKAKAPAMTLDDLKKIVSSLSKSVGLINIRNSALIQLGFFGAFRRSELVTIKWEDITFSNEGIEIVISRSKTDQSGEGQVCAIPNGNDVVCAVRALKLWQEYSGLTEGFIFRGISKSENMLSHAIKSNQVNLIIKQIARDCGLENANDYSAHSLRRGFATEAAKRNAPFQSIMLQGRWKHEGTVLGYIDEGRRFEGNAAVFLF
jgi:integrase